MNLREGPDSRMARSLSVCTAIPARFALCVMLALPAGVTAQPGAATEPGRDASRAAADWEGSLGLSLSHGPSYPGSARSSAGLRPAFFLRYRRVTLSRSAGLPVRRSGAPAALGLGLDLLRSDALDVGLSLRYDRGRQESADAAFRGLGDIDATLRGRLSVDWRLTPRFQLGGSWSQDLQGKGGANADLALTWVKALARDRELAAGLALAWGDRRYNQAFQGVTPAQAAASAYPAYQADAGLREVTAFLRYRMPLSRDWVAQLGLGWSELQGPAAASPLTQRRGAGSVNAGVVWHF